MKTRGKLTLAILLAGGLAFQAHGQSVTLGEATFDANSDQMPADWYYPMSVGSATCDGTGDNEGASRTETFSLGESVEGVKCIKRRIVVSSPDAADVSEDWWLAIDTSGDIRVLKCYGTNLAAFTASATSAAPMFLPGTPADGQSWGLFGRTLTVEDVVESAQVGSLIVTSEAEGTETTTVSYFAGVGVFSSETGSSGWQSPTVIAPEPDPEEPPAGE